MNHSKFIEDARPLIKFIEEQGGPKMYEWVGLGGYIHDTETYTERYAECPPAVTAAICMWVLDVIPWFKSNTTVDPDVPENGQDGLWYWGVYHGEDKQLLGSKRTKELAFLALLNAICKTIGYEGEIK